MRVSLFVTCLVDQMRPSVGLATARLLRHLNCEVVFNPEQTCCGQPAYTTGNHDDCARVIKRTIGVLESDASDWVVVPSGSCAAMFHHFSSLLEEPEWRSRANEVAGKTKELTDFLVNVLGITRLDARFEGRTTWHDACHGLRDLGLRDEGRKLMAGVRGLELVEMENCDACCGFGGVFSVTYPNVSTAMADVKLDEIENQGVHTIVSGDVGCLMQLDTRLQERGSSIRTLHIAEVLAPDD